MGKILKNKMIYIITILVILDQLTKVGIAAFVSSGSQEIIPNVLTLEVAENSGIAFGFAQSSNMSMILSNLVVIIVVAKFFSFQNKRLDKKMKVALPLILAGGISNVIDRIVRGHVMDYIHIQNLPIFNIADIYILIGWVLFALSFAIYTRKELGNIHNGKRNKKDSNERGD